MLVIFRIMMMVALLMLVSPVARVADGAGSAPAPPDGLDSRSSEPSRTVVAVDVERLLHPQPPVKDAFETDQEFAARVEKFAIHRKELLRQFNQLAGGPAVAAGSAELLKELYDADTGRFPVKLQASGWAAGYLNVIAPHLRLSRDAAKTLYGAGAEHPVYIRLQDDGELEGMFLEVASQRSPVEFSHPDGGFVKVPAGSFAMGSTDGGSDERPIHEVSVSAFEIGKYEVTQGQWRAVMGADPARLNFRECGPDCPVENVSWSDVQQFIGKMNARNDGCHYRLPTEAEWEYACRSGGKDEKYCGMDEVEHLAWYDANSGDVIHPVGQKVANGLGLHDMSGNVWEWVGDWYAASFYADSPEDDPQGPAEGAGRVFRGGSWFSSPAHLRATFRNDNAPGDRSYNLGFRLARTCR